MAYKAITPIDVTHRERACLNKNSVLFVSLHHNNNYYCIPSQMILMKTIGRRLASQKYFIRKNQLSSNPLNNNILTIKDSCLHRLKEILDNPNEKHLRINVEAGGCSGFLYLFDIETSENINPSDDIIVQRDQFKIVIEKEVLPYIRGSQIEYEESLIKSSFKITNPIAESKCGCGASFSIDFNKKQDSLAESSKSPIQSS